MTRSGPSKAKIVRFGLPLTKSLSVLLSVVMPDPVDPVSPPPPPVPPEPEPAGGPSTNFSSTGLPSNVAAALACIPLIGGIIFYVLEKRDEFVRFYAMQSIIFGGAWFLFNIISLVMQAIFSSVPFVGRPLLLLWALIAMIVHLGFLVIWILATVKAFTTVRWDIPYVGPIARKQLGETTV
jgi:uncharacterized membrane protein